jgi:hypothetical protein
MRRRFLVASVVLMFGFALTLTSCAGADQQGDAAHRMSAWVGGTTFGADVGTLVADNARVPKVAPNGSGALHAACSTTLNDAEMGYAELPSPDPDVNQLLNSAYMLEQTSANDCYDANGPDTKLLTESVRDGIKAQALFNEALQRIRQIDGKVVSTTTTTDNTTGNIFG